MKKRIAFFDFDGTITTKDTLLEIIKYHHGNAKFLFGFGLNAPFIAAFKAGIISNQSAKERVLRFFFGRMPVSVFQEKCDQFAKEELPALLRPKALAEIHKLKELGAEVVIVSASAGHWISSWCADNNLKLIATRLDENDGKLTGKISGRNCHGDEKVARIKELFDLKQYDEIYCYGDTKGDKPMLGLATFSFYAPFR
ncbi:MAG: haloacid dehalogenase-like hydrolase [Gemmatimonadaceae bacterium]|nr:haloacid dehalogenase-like hydrolase [Chitinophagaceae bacterium]